MALRLSPLLALLLAFVVASSVGATTTPTVPVSVFITGGGVLHVGAHTFVCPGSEGSCFKSVNVAPGTKLVVRAQKARGAKLKWTAGCKGTAVTCSLRITKPTRLAVTFIPLGAQINPIPFRQPATVYGGWRIRVLSVTPNADAKILATPATNGYSQKPPPAGAQDYLVSISAKFVGGGSADLHQLATESLSAVGSHGASYSEGYNECAFTLPSPDLAAGGEVFSGRTVTGNVCWQIASNDAATLQLVTYSATLPGQKTFFALR